MDYAHGNWLTSFMTGGLNYQVKKKMFYFVHYYFLAVVFVLFCFVRRSFLSVFLYVCFLVSRFRLSFVCPFVGFVFVCFGFILFVCVFLFSLIFVCFFFFQNRFRIIYFLAFHKYIIHKSLQLSRSIVINMESNILVKNNVFMFVYFSFVIRKTN
jgi:hypothetical protein